MIKPPRHHLFLEAREFARSPSLDYRGAWGAVGPIASNAKSYAKEVKDRAIVLVHSVSGKVLVIPFFTRFSDGYYDRAVRKIKRIRANDAVFLTLTIDPRRHTSLDDAYRSLTTSWNKLLTMLKKRHGGLKFVKVVEFQKNGSPHVHVLFFGVSRLIDANELRKFWDSAYGVGKFIYLKKIKNDRAQVCSYLIKYMSKPLTMPDVEFSGPDGLTDAKSFTHLALSWSLNLRAYSCSRGILDSPMTNSNHEWKFLGVFNLIDVFSWDGRLFSELKSEFYELKPPWEVD
jgi:hypothetical protein